MRSVVLYQLLSLDGVAEEPGDWMFEAGPEIFDNLAAVIGRQDTVLLGRGTYDYWCDYWPTSDVQPFANFINGTEKHVVTSTPLTGSWQNSTAVHTDAADHVRSLAAQDGGDIGIHGSIGLAQSLLAAGLVDELQLVVVPTVAGRGRRLLEPGSPTRRLALVRSERSSSGDLLITYVFRPDDSTPS